jgi:hypothetical protein
MDNWDQEAIDLVEPGFIEFGEDGLGGLGFIGERPRRSRDEGSASLPPNVAKYPLEMSATARRSPSSSPSGMRWAMP